MVMLTWSARVFKKKKKQAKHTHQKTHNKTNQNPALQCLMNALFSEYTSQRTKS